jgi:hypothetical protein
MIWRDILIDRRPSDAVRSHAADGGCRRLAVFLQQAATAANDEAQEDVDLYLGALEREARWSVDLAVRWNAPDDTIT